MSPFNKTFYALLAVFVMGLGIAGSTNFDDAQRDVQDASEDTRWLQCEPISFHASLGQSSFESGPASLRHVIRTVIDIEPETFQTIFHCALVND